MYSEKDNKSVLSNELPGINSVEAVNIVSVFIYERKTNDEC